MEQKTTAEIRERFDQFCKRADFCLHQRTKNMDNSLRRIEDSMGRVEDGLDRNRDDLMRSIETRLVGIVREAQCNALVSLYNIILWLLTGQCAHEITYKSVDC